MATIKYLGQRTVSTLAGQIKLEEGNGRLIVRDPVTLLPRQIQDIDGSHYYDDEGDELTRVDTDGLKVFDKDNDNNEIVRGGKFPGNNGYGFAVAEEGESIQEAIT